MKKIALLLLYLSLTMCTKAQKIEDLKVDTTKTSEINNINKTLQNTTWETLYDRENRKNFKLLPFKQRKFAGVLTRFSNEGTFETEYVAPCGNDYFWAKHGKYKLLSNNKIAIQIDSIRFWGMNEKPTEYPKKLKIYILKKHDNTFVFKE